MSVSTFSFTSRARPVVEIGLGDSRSDVGGAVWDTSVWDADGSVWAGNEPWWFDVTCYVNQLSYTYGRRRATDRFEVGSANLDMDNHTGWADPRSTEDPQMMQLRPGRAVRVGVEHEVLGYVPLWRGFVDETEPHYEPGRDTAKLSAICALGEVGRAQIGRVETPQGDGDTAAVRIIRIANLAGWPNKQRDIAATTDRLMATQLGASAADLMAVTADSVGGAVWGDTRGYLVFRPRDWQTYDANLPPDAVIGNRAGDVCPTGWEISSRRRDIVTRVVLGRQDEDRTYQYESVQGQLLYGVETYTATDLVPQDTAIFPILSNRLFRTRGQNNTPRVDSVTLDAATSPEALDLLTTLDVFKPTRVRCRYQHPTRGQIFNRQMFAAGVTVSMSRDSWSARVDLDNAGPWGRNAPGVWSESLWDQANWVGQPALEEVS